MSAFAAANAPLSSWSLAPLPGLRALTLELSWRAWTLPAGETLEDLLLGEDGDIEGAAVQVELEEETRETSAAVDKVGVDEPQDDDMVVTSMITLPRSAEDDDDEPLVPRVPVMVDRQVVEVAGHSVLARLDDGSADERSFSTVSPGNDALEGGCGAPVQPVPPTDRPFLDEPPPAAPLDSDLVASAQHRPRLESSSLTAVPDSSSSDFGFIFPPGSSPSSPPGQHAGAVSPPAAYGCEPVYMDTVELPDELESPAQLQAVSQDEPVARLEMVDPGRPAWSSAAALDRFLAARGQAALASTEPETRAAPPAPSTVVEPAPPSAHSSPPPGAIPFTSPPFLSRAHLPHSSLDQPVRIITFDALLHMRPHLAALRRQSFLAFHRSSRFPADPRRTLEPHLIVDPRSAALFVRLDALVSNVVRVDEPMVGSLPRPEAVMTTLARLAARFDRVLVVLEESGQRIGGVKRYGFTPPVLAALQQLASELAELEGGRHGVEIALSKGAEHSATLVRRWADYLREEDEAASVEEGLPVLELWGGRAWLSEDPSPVRPACLPSSVPRFTS